MHAENVKKEQDIVNKEISNYTVKAIVYAYLDLVLWFKAKAEK